MPFLEEIHAEIAFQTIIEMLIYRMLRLRSLYYEHTLLFASSASSTKLQKQLQCLLIRTEVLNSEQTVSSYDRHKAKIAEIETFGNYLCSYKDINLTFAEFLAMRACGKRAAASSSILWVPAPNETRVPWHLLHLPVN